MPRVTWSEITRSEAHVLVAQVEASFCGGRIQADPFDSKRLKEAANLIIRVSSALKLPGRYAATPSRGADGEGGAVLCAYASKVDRDTVGDFINARICAESEGWLSRRAFPLTDSIHQQLVMIGGDADNRYAGRRRRLREEDDLKWASPRWNEF